MTLRSISWKTKILAGLVVFAACCVPVLLYHKPIWQKILVYYHLFSDREQIRACVVCSARQSRVNNPCQSFFEDHIFDTEVFHTDRYVHIRVRVDGQIAGFHIFQICGQHMGGVLGGFNRDHTRNNFVYERVIVASLQYAIERGLAQVHYSLVDNHTKQRLVPSRRPCGVYFFSGNPMNRKVFEFTYKYGDMYDLYLLEQEK